VIRSLRFDTTGAPTWNDAPRSSAFVGRRIRALSDASILARSAGVTTARMMRFDGAPTGVEALPESAAIARAGRRAGAQHAEIVADELPALSPVGDEGDGEAAILSLEAGAHCVIPGQTVYPPFVAFVKVFAARKSVSSPLREIVSAEEESIVASAL
jgi:hypothetical protein